MKRGSIKDIWDLLGQRRRYYMLASALLLVSIFFRALEPKILQLTVDQVLAFYTEGAAREISEGDHFGRWLLTLLPDTATAALGSILLAIAGLYILISLGRGGSMLLASALTASSTEATIKELRDRMFRHIQSLPLAYFGRIPTGELVQKTTGDVDTVRRFISEQVVEVVRMAALFGFSFWMMYMIDPVLAFVSVCASPILFAGSFWFFKQEGKIWEAHEAEADKLNAIAQENLNGIRMVKAYAREAHEMDKFDRQNLVKRAVGMRQIRLHAWYWSLSDTVVLGQIALSVIFGGYLVMHQQLSIGELLGCFTYMSMVTWPMRQIGRVVSQMGMATVALGRIQEILEVEPEDYPSDQNPDCIRGEIEFRNVWFRYDEAEDWIIRDLSLRIPAGQRIAFVGPAGAGKSTLIQLLLRFYEPQQGSILLDGRDIREYDKQFLRLRAGLVLQKPFLFSTTIRDNIAYTADESEDARIDEVAHMAHADKLQEILHEGFDTAVGEKGVSLSGGQKQRVALARTLYAGTDLLILDDITSAVDTETELGIFERLEPVIRNKTTIIISHRLTSLQLAGRIVVLEGGLITADGTHKELVNKDGYYKQINDLQLGLESELLAELEQLK